MLNLENAQELCVLLGRMGLVIDSAHRRQMNIVASGSPVDGCSTVQACLKENVSYRIQRTQVGT